MAKSAINRHYSKLKYKKILNHAHRIRNVNFGHNKRKISDFILENDEYFVNIYLRYKQNKIKNKEKDYLEELPSIYLNYWEYLESLDKGECDFADYSI